MSSQDYFVRESSGGCQLSVLTRLVAVVLLLAVFPAGAEGQRQIPGAIRVEVTLVPLDVMVTDKEGRPVLDLTRDDFAIVENGVLQEIIHFSLQRFDQTPPPVLAVKDEPEKPAARETLLSSPNHRTFLIVLGRGRHQVFRSIDSLVRFVRQELTPMDRVAVMAYNRATDFTTHHEKIAAILERYASTHEYIETVMRMRLRGLAAVYGSREIPRSLQPRIDGIFEVSDVASRRVIPGDAVGLSEQARRDRQGLADTTRAEQQLLEEDLPEEVQTSPLAERARELEMLETELMTDLPFDEYMQERAGTDQDLLNLYAAIQYLRFVDGEKHVLFFTSEGLFLPNMEDEKSLASVASDARVRIHNLHTGGVHLEADVGFTPGAAGSRREFAAAAAGTPAVRGSFSHSFAVSSLRQVSSLTGGQSFISQDIGRALGTLNEATGSVYLLGYRPKNENFDGRFRHIDVRVLGRDVRVYARRGYYASPTVKPYDRKQFMTYARTVSAANYSEPVRDLEFSFEVRDPRVENEQTRLDTALKVQLREEMFTFKEGLYFADLAITSFVFSDDGRLLVDRWDRLDLKVIEATYRRLLQEGIPLTRRFQLPGRLKKGWLKIVIYDAANDKVGSQMKKIG